MFQFTTCTSWFTLQFPNAVVINAVGRRNTQMRAKEHKRAQKSANARAQKGAKGRKRALLRKNCRQPGLKQPWERGGVRVRVRGGFCSLVAQDGGGPGQGAGTHTGTDRHTHTHTQERTRECCTYPLAKV